MRAFTVFREKHKTRGLFRVAISLPAMCAILYLLSGHLAGIDTTRLSDALATMSPMSIMMAAFLTATSLFAVAGYDRLASRQMQLDIMDVKTREGGFAAVAISQAAGFGMLTGSFVRWRMYRHRGVSYIQAVALTALVLAGFTVGFILTLSVAIVLGGETLTKLTGLDVVSLRLLALLGLFSVAVCLLMALFQPKLVISGRMIPIPRVRLVCAQIKLAICDLVPAAAALWVLIPADGDISLVMLLPVYLVALAIGMVTNMPGGLGVLELACLMAFPLVPPEDLLAALIVYRGVYYAAPALLATALLAAREVSRPGEIPSVPSHPLPGRAQAKELFSRSTKAEARFADLGDKRFFISSCGDAALMYGISGNSFVALGDPVGKPTAWPELLSDFRSFAAANFAAPVHYKVSSRVAVCLTDIGYSVARVGVNGIIDPVRFSTEGAKFSRLRRTLRAAGKAGVKVTCHAPGEVDLDRLEPVARQWVREKGRERGFSMGYWDAAYLRRQHVLVAEVNGQVAGFITLVCTPDCSEFALDLVRISNEAPPGTAQVLVVEAIALSRRLNATRFSLAAVPLAGTEKPGNAIETILLQIRSRFCDNGLLQFKSGFRPQWETIYAAAPTQVTLGCGLKDTYTLVNEGPRAKHVTGQGRQLTFHKTKTECPLATKRHSPSTRQNAGGEVVFNERAF
jgi:phosphatidylglycerol lysyltransferase